MKKIVFILFCTSFFIQLYAQKEPAWDNTSKRKWYSEFEK